VTADDYVLGRTGAEHHRLVQQAHVLRPSTERLLRAAGIRPGMRVLDVGCGVGDVSFLVAELVGATGNVVGVDVDAAALNTADQRRDELDLGNVAFTNEDLQSVLSRGDFDAVVGRLVLMYQPDPTETLRTIANALHSGGIVVFQELASGMMSWQLPNVPLMTSVIGWVRAAFAQSGAHVNLGWELYWRMRDAGLIPHPGPLAELPLDVGSESVAYERWALIVRSLMPTITSYNIATETEIDIQTLEQRLRAEAVEARATVPLFSGVVVGQWAHKAGT